jgi:hypothetical protein
MKPILTLFIALFLCSSTFLSAQKGGKLVGSWKKIYTKITDADGQSREYQIEDPVEQQVRIYNRTHYAFGSQNADGSLGGAGGGRYKILEKGVAEHWRDYHIAGGGMVGTSTKFEYSVKNDTLSLKGMLPNNALWEEKFVRIR